MQHREDEPKNNRQSDMLYFAYGSNMPEARLLARVPSAVKVETATLYCHRLCFHKVSVDGSGKCDALCSEEECDCVIGVVYRIDPIHKPELDRIENLCWGYEERQVTVVTAAGEKIAAFTYCAIKIDPARKPYTWYKHHVLTGAREHGLPPKYIARIEAIKAIEDPDPARAERELLIYKTGRPRR